MDKETIELFFKALQDKICDELEQQDGIAAFRKDNWERKGGGGGRTRVIEDGAVIEKGGVNFSGVHGNLPETIINKLQLNVSGFFATGISIVIHPLSPMVPIIHMNIRYFEMTDGTAWFGGGIDLTPHYVNTADAKFFHGRLKEICQQFDPSYYPTFKTWADDYFYLPHREETRGVGGIFFDRLAADSNHSMEDRFGFVRTVGETFLPIYTHLIADNRDIPYGEPEKQWQLLRRGRYVEFNLLYDKGTRFGLETNGRVESILMSLPKAAGWPYHFKAEPGSPEEKTMGFLRKGVDWV